MYSTTAILVVCRVSLTSSFPMQVLVDTKACRGLYSGREDVLTDAAVGSYTFPITDPAGKPIVAPGASTMEGKGVMSFSVRVPSLAYRYSILRSI